MKLVKCWLMDGLFVYIYIDIVEVVVIYDLKIISIYFMFKVFIFFILFNC